MSDAGEWLLVGLEEKMARRQGVPAKIPVPKGDFEGIADQGLNPAQLKKWITAFLQVAPSSWRTQEPELAKAFDRYLSKVDLWTKAQGAFDKQDFKTAISTLKLIGNLDPDDHAAKMNLASALASTGDHPGALKLLEQIRASFEGEPDYHTTLGQLLAATGKRDEAIDELVLALEAKGDHQPALDVMRQLGVLVAIYENPRDAASLTYVRSDAVLAYLESVWDQGERDAAYYLEQAAYHTSENRHVVALAAAERAFARGGASMDRAEAAKIQALRALGRLDDALAASQAFAARAPDAAAAHVELAQTLRDRGDADGAKAATERALQLEPSNLMALDLAFWPRQKDDIALIEKVVAPLFAFADKHDREPGPWRSLARAKLALNSYDEAFELYKMALALSPDDDDLRAEYWTELGRQQRYDDILQDAAKVGDMAKRDWKLRWNEAEALLRAGKKTEARAAFSQINFDQSLHVDVRKRAKRAAQAVSG